LGLATAIQVCFVLSSEKIEHISRQAVVPIGNLF
jgi:hypothetical protein